MKRAELISMIREVSISGKTYEEYVEAVADRLLSEGELLLITDAKSNNSEVKSNKQIEEAPKITKIYEPIEVTDEMRKLADEMQKAISDEYRRRVLADERALEAVLKENGWRKATEVAREIFEEIEELLNLQAKIVCETRDKYRETDEPMLSFIAMLDGRIYSLRVVEEHIAELKKKYIGKDTNVPTNTEDK